MADCRPNREQVIWGHFDDEHELLALEIPGSPDGSAGPVNPPEAEYLVCVHGTHDACCAIRGRPVAAALEVYRPGRVWECSHVGGDRFATNLLVLPVGLLYGRVVPRQAPDLVRMTDAGRVDTTCALRGRIGFSAAEQAAIVLAHQTFPTVGWSDIRVRTVDSSDQHSIVVGLAVAGTNITIAVAVHLR